MNARHSSISCLVMLLTLPSAALGQGMSLADAQIADLEEMKGKFHQLAEAIPQDKWDWRPMEGVRSVKDVFILMIGEGNLFPTMWGYGPAPGSPAAFGDEMARIEALPNDQIIAEMDKAFDHIIGIIRSMDQERRMSPVSFFGRDTTTGVAVTLAASDMHEHLGQLIAYARVNLIVPPWSSGM